MKLNTQSLADVTLGTPLLSEGTYFGKFVKVEAKENSKKTGNNLVIEMKIIDPEIVERDSGKVIKNNGSFKLFRYISLVPTETYDPNRALKEIAIAVGMPEDVVDIDTNDILNQICKVVVKKKPAEGQYAEGNDIQGFRKLEANDVVPDQVPF